MRRTAFFVTGVAWILVASCSVEEKTGYTFSDDAAGGVGGQPKGASGAAGLSGRGGGGDTGQAGGAGEPEAGGAAGALGGSSGSGGGPAPGDAGSAGAEDGGAGLGGAAGESSGGALAGGTGGGGRGGTAGIAGKGGGGSGGKAGSGGTGGTWCTGKSAPSGVLALDFQCVDFDVAMPPAATWAPPSGGASARTTARAASPPASWMSVSSSTQPNATLVWRPVGAAAIASVSVAADLNPVNLGGVVPTDWTVALLCIEYGSGEACLQRSGTGVLSIEYLYSGGPAFRDACPVTGTLTANLWKRAELTLARTGAITLSLAGVSGTTGCSIGVTLNDTAAEVRIGAATPASGAGFTSYYDNVVGAIRR